MMMKRYIILTLMFFLLGAEPLFADTVYLKNGRKMQGIVTKENDDAVSLNVGFGTVELARDQVEKVEKDGEDEHGKMKQEWGDKYFLRTEYIPEKFRDIGYKLKKLDRVRHKAARAKRRQDLKREEVLKEETKLTLLNKEALPLSEKLAKMSPEENIPEYNKAVSEYNYLLAQIKVQSDKIHLMEREVSESNVDISEYYRQFKEFSDFLFERAAYVGDDISDEEKAFLDKVKETVSEYDKDFQKFAVKYKKLGKDLVVNVVLNETVTARLIVDTGATNIRLSPRIAKQLGIPTGSVEYTGKVRVADGRIVNVYPFVLKSVVVGNAKAENVNAHVGKEDDAITDYDGLLGMSFLENFIFRIDASKNTIVFEKFLNK